VSVCPPAYYAHLVAARARFHATESLDVGGLEIGGMVGSRGRGRMSSVYERGGLVYGVVKGELAKMMYFM
jgi:hypothetical protein